LNEQGPIAFNINPNTSIFDWCKKNFSRRDTKPMWYEGFPIGNHPTTMQTWLPIKKKSLEIPSP
jgi:hypothetical protein